MINIFLVKVEVAMTIVIEVALHLEVPVIVTGKLK